jgi:hypothetical protein
MTHAAFALHAWTNFYVMTGSSAAALTGLVFVVIALGAQIERVRQTPEGISTFGTPTVLHFCAALFVSAVLAAPWHSLVPAAILAGLAGLYGIVHISRVMHRSTRLTVYKPDLEDWTWYTVLPLVAYATILGGAVALSSHPHGALFALAGGIVLLLFIGIRNAWDTVTFLVVGGPHKPGA